MEQVEDNWAEEIAVLRAEVLRQYTLAAQTHAGAETVLAGLQQEFIAAPLPAKLHDELAAVVDLFA